MGTVLSGWLYQKWGLEACLWWSASFVLMTTIISIGLPKQNSDLGNSLKYLAESRVKKGSSN